MGALGAHRGAAAPPRRQPRSACTRAGASSPLPPSIYRRARSHRAGPSPISSRSSSSIGTGSGDRPRQGRPPRPRGCRAALPTTCCPQINQFQGFYYFFFPVSSQKEPGQEEPGQILAKKKKSRGTSWAVRPSPWPRGTSLAMSGGGGHKAPCVRAPCPEQFLFFLPKCCAKQPRNAAPASHQQPQPPLQKGQRCTNASPPPRVRFAKPWVRTES